MLAVGATIAVGVVLAGCASGSGGAADESSPSAAGSSSSQAPDPSSGDAPAGAETSGADEPAAPDLSGDLTYALWDQNQVAAINANLEGFNKLHPNVKVSVDVTPWGEYWTKLQTEASSDTLPDLFWMNGPNFQLYASNGMLQPLTSQV
jgi:multiple sugar transport system substrate-binding protein